MIDRKGCRWNQAGAFLRCVTGAAVVMFCCAAGFAQSQTDGAGANADATSEAISFSQQIRPILSDKCFQCHGPDEESREAGLRFDRRESAMTMIEPGDAESSELVFRITAADDPDYQMPPPEAHKPLQPEEIELLTRWIEQGAKWDEFWAYVPPREHPIPELESDDWSANWIDRMVLERLREHGLKPSPPTDRVTLLRRLSFDLVGLPPTPQQVQEFVNDSSPDAYAKQVDRLLASPHFGERLAMYWLDLVRFADTVGYHGDQDHNISPYRDWVIQSLNDNLPFDQFTREQLAGDLLPNPTIEQKVASGYNRLLQTTHEGGLQPMEYRAIYAADRVRNVSAVWMGATVGCAQCHDHKYDPYTAKDFYSLSAFFADLDDEQHFKNGTNALPTRRSPEMLVISDEDQRLLDHARERAGQQRQQVNQLRQQLKELEASLASQPGESSETSGDGNQASESGEAASKDESPPELEALKSRISAAEQEQKKLDAEAKVIESRGAWTMISQPLDEPREVRLLPRGNWLDDSGPIVEPAIPEFLGELETDGRRATRLDLANWLTDASATGGKLTARVQANRFWYLLMGVGVSRTLDDFGGQGQAPADPALLDNLALDFASDWNIKRFLRQVVMSQTYRQSSRAPESLRQRDPYNQLFARQSRYRLPAELVRDTALSISGLLQLDRVGGRSVKPYQPEGYYRHMNFPPRKYRASEDRDQWRRGVYVHWQRMFLHPTFKALDAPSREECTAQRDQSNTPLAALALLNDPSFVEAARVFAARILEQSPAPTFSARLEFAFQLALNRNPVESEQAVLQALYRESRAEFENDVAGAELLVSTGLAPRGTEAEAPELAAWTQVARAILNLNETMTRN